jgi:hypothetical protein
MKEFPFKSSFSSYVKPLVSEAKDEMLALASLKEIGKFIPNIDIKKNSDLLPVAFNACVINRVNKNGDVIDTPTAIAMYKEFINKPINLEHHRQHVLGVILVAGFSKFGSDEPMSEADAEKMTKPFNIVLGGVVWRIVSPEVSEFIEESNDPTSDKYLGISASWELGFSDYDIAVLPAGVKDIAGAKIISDPTEIENLKKHLRALGGDGKYDDEFYYRKPKDVLPLGIGFTEKPAAEVKGIATEKKPQVNEDHKPTFAECSASTEHFKVTCSCGNVIRQCRCNADNKKVTTEEKGCDKCKTMVAKDVEIAQALEELKNLYQQFENGVITREQLEQKSGAGMLKAYEAGASKNLKIISQSANTNVNKERTMKIETLKDITDENLKEAKASQIAEFVAAELKKGNDSWLNEKSNLTNQVSEHNKANEKLNKDVTDLNTKVKELSATIEGLNKEKTDREAVDKFNTRMSEITEAYELDDEARAAVVEEVKSIASDEAFDKWKKKAAVLLKGYAKVKVTKKDDDSNEDAGAKTKKSKADDGDEDDTEAKKKAKAAEAVAALEEQLAKAKKDAGLPNSSTTEVSLKEKYKQAFAADQIIVKL